MAAMTRRGGPGPVACVVLAAGGSSRLGAPKQLARDRGRALLRRAVDAAAAVPGPVIVVVGADALRHRALLRRTHPRCRVVANPRWREGLAGSLRAGLAAAPPRARAALFMLADQPGVDAGSLERLIGAWRRRPSRPAAARYGGRLGVPAVFPRSWWAALRAQRGDVGARALLASDADIGAVEMPEAAFDVDTPADLARLSPAGRGRESALRRFSARRVDPRRPPPP